MKANFILFCLNQVRIDFSGRKSAWSSAKPICRVGILPDLRKPFASEIFVKLSKMVQSNDSQTIEVQCTALQDLQSGKSFFALCTLVDESSTFSLAAQHSRRLPWTVLFSTGSQLQCCNMEISNDYIPHIVIKTCPDRLPSSH